MSHPPCRAQAEPPSWFLFHPSSSQGPILSLSSPSLVKFCPWYLVFYAHYILFLQNHLFKIRIRLFPIWKDSSSTAVYPLPRPRSKAIFSKSLLQFSQQIYGRWLAHTRLVATSTPTHCSIRVYSHIQSSSHLTMYLTMVNFIGLEYKIYQGNNTMYYLILSITSDKSTKS